MDTTSMDIRDIESVFDNVTVEKGAEDDEADTVTVQYYATV